MNTLKHALALLLLLFCTAASALAGDKDPLFINLTSDDPHRAEMAINFGKAQMGLGHPLTIFLNDKGVFVASVTQAPRFAKHQETLAELAAKGATIIVCPTCTPYFGLKQEDFVKGLQMGRPDLTGPALFKDNTKTLSW
jgi:sulfur relay (sulfurtransferase) complex TusBCD TusD component (DsrE family)